MKQYEKFLMQQNEVYTLYKNYTSDIMQALKEKGLDVDTDITTIEEARIAILKALRG